MTKKQGKTCNAFSDIRQRPFYGGTWKKIDEAGPKQKDKGNEWVTDNRVGAGMERQETRLGKQRKSRGKKNKNHWVRTVVIKKLNEGTKRNVDQGGEKKEPKPCRV